MERRKLSSDFYTISKENGVNTINININELYPLYKYQPVTDYTLANLDNGEVWGTVPYAFNDPYDSICCYSESKIKNSIGKYLSKDRLNNYKTFLGINQRKQLIEFIATALLDNYNENIRKQYCVSCFSIYNDSEIMWGHYANCGKGFAIAYDGIDLYNCATSSHHAMFNMLKNIRPFDIDLSHVKEEFPAAIFPVIYCDWKENITNQIINFVPQILECYDEMSNGKTCKDALIGLIYHMQQKFYDEVQPSSNLFYNMMCHKNKCWSYEQEWRIWSYNTNAYTGNLSSPYVKIGIVPARALYLGEKISTYNRLILMDIAKRQSIPVYQMQTKMYNHSCRLQAIEIK